MSAWCLRVNLYWPIFFYAVRLCGLVATKGTDNSGFRHEAVSEKNRHAEQPMRFDARSLLAGCVLAVGLGASVFSADWTHRSLAGTPGQLRFIADRPPGPGKVTPVAEREKDPNAADEALQADTSWESWRPVVDF